MELEQIDGIGPKTKELLEKLNIYTVDDLINHYPFRYEVLKRSNLSEIQDGDKITIDGIIEGQPTIIYLSPKLKKIIFRVNTGSNIINGTIYNQEYLMQNIKVGKPITLIGRYDKIKNTIIANEVRFELLPSIPKIESIYYTGLASYSSSTSFCPNSRPWRTCASLPSLQVPAQNKPPSMPRNCSTT